MRTTMTTEDLGSAFGAPRSGDSLSEIVRALGVLVGRQQMRQWLERVAAEVGSDLPLAAGWVLVQLRRDPAVDLLALAEVQNVPSAVLDPAMTELLKRDLITETPSDGRADGDGTGAETALGALSAVLTSSGAALADQLIDAVRGRLERLLEGWSPEQVPELVRLLQSFATEIVPGTTVVTAGEGSPALGP